MQELYRIKIKHHDLEIEVESSDKEFVLEQIKTRQAQVLEAERTPAPPTNRANTTPAAAPTQGDHMAQGKKLSLSELFQRARLKGAPETAVLIAFYKEKYEGAQEVTTKDVLDAFRQIKVKCLNVPLAISRARTHGYLMNGSTAKSFITTNTGDQLIQERLIQLEAK